jgi:ppGpp synthetase/RelA/SpoT-type nucleotidyltranferase
MDLIAQFIARYRKEFDFYDQASRLAAQKLEETLQSAGIRSMVTFRAKSFARLEDKVRQRDKTKSYRDVDAIYIDLVDLAGVRVDLPPFLRQTVKTQNPMNGEMSHGFVT